MTCSISGCNDKGCEWGWDYGNDGTSIFVCPTCHTYIIAMSNAYNLNLVEIVDSMTVYGMETLGHRYLKT